MTPRGTLQADPETMATSRPDVFAGGDVAWPAHHHHSGRRRSTRGTVDREILTGWPPPPNGQRRGVTIYRHRPIPDARRYEKMSHMRRPVLPLDRRIGIAEVERHYPEQGATFQGLRCLKCHISPVLRRGKCVLCGGCSDVCRELSALGGCRELARQRDTAGGVRRSLRPVPNLRAGAIIKDETRCIRCGLCAVRCRPSPS